MACIGCGGGTQGTQTGSNVTFRGMVVDQNDKEVPNAKIERTDTGEMVSTNNDGFFELNTARPSGSIEFAISGEGFRNSLVINRNIPLSATVVNLVAEINRNGDSAELILFEPESGSSSTGNNDPILDGNNSPGNNGSNNNSGDSSNQGDSSDSSSDNNDNSGNNGSDDSPTPPEQESGDDDGDDGDGNEITPCINCSGNEWGPSPPSQEGGGNENEGANGDQPDIGDGDGSEGGGEQHQPPQEEVPDTDGGDVEAPPQQQEGSQEEAGTEEPGTKGEDGKGDPLLTGL